jgi:hypothetical protein
MSSLQVVAARKVYSLNDIKAALDQGEQLVQARQLQQEGEPEEQSEQQAGAEEQQGQQQGRQQGQQDDGDDEHQDLARHDVRGHRQLLQLLQAQPGLLEPLAG